MSSLDAATELLDPLVARARQRVGHILKEKWRYTANAVGHHGVVRVSDVAAQWQFLKDHPFGIAKDPYADELLPSFPSYCKPTIAGQDN